MPQPALRGLLLSSVVPRQRIGGWSLSIEANCRLRCKRTLPGLPAVTGWSQELSATSFAESGRNTANSRCRAEAARPPDLRHLALTTRALRLVAPRPARQRLLSDSCPSARGFAPRFLPTRGHPHAVALRFIRRGQLMGGLPPPRSRPCWAHNNRNPAEAGFDAGRI